MAKWYQDARTGEGSPLMVLKIVLGIVAVFAIWGGLMWLASS